MGACAFLALFSVGLFAQAGVIQLFLLLSPLATIAGRALETRMDARSRQEPAEQSREGENKTMRRIMRRTCFKAFFSLNNILVLFVLLVFPDLSVQAVVAKIFAFQKGVKHLFAFFNEIE